MRRREFIKSASVVAAGLGISGSAYANVNEQVKSNSAKFKLKYAPGLGMFQELTGSKDPIDQIKFISDQGFTAIFDNGFPGRDIPTQEKIAAELSNRNMDFGPYVLYADFSSKSMVLKDDSIRKMLVEKINQAVEIKKRTGFGLALMVPGRYDERLSWDYQTANVIDILRELSDIAHKGGVTIVLEPLNFHRDHPWLFLKTIPQTYMICRAVNSPSCKIVNDLYHQQITEGNLIPNIDLAWSEIGAFHCGDNPGRKDKLLVKLTTEAYSNIYTTRVVIKQSVEHGKNLGKIGEQAVIDAYRFCDNF
ncbi:hypothetical protein MASR1M31_23810 [Porphyromonadaceae bacterium]